MKKVMLIVLMMISFTSLLMAQEEPASAKKAPDFILKDLNAKDYCLYKNLGDGPIVINFWATWCVPCIEEMKKIKKLHKKYADQGVQFLAISLDDPKTVGRVKSFAKSRRYPFKVLLDTNNEVIRLLQGTVPPYTVVLDKAGNIEYTHVGYRVGDEKKLEAKIKELLK